MFSLIISIISIALVAALAAATVYFGGAAFNKGGAGADASTFINAGMQVAGAYTLAEATAVNVSSTDLSDLVTQNFLASVPTFKGATVTLGTDAGELEYIVNGTVSDDICTEINVRAVGANGTAPTSVTGLYGCVVGVDTAPNKAFYKVQ